MKKVYFVRHGEAEGNAKGIAQDTHTPLTEKGHEQARIVAKRISSLGIEKIYTSHMGRAIDTGKYIAEELQLEAEQNDLFGEWLNPSSIRGKSIHSEEYQSWLIKLKENLSNLDWRHEDHENFADIKERLHASTKFIETCEADSILIVTHGKFMWLLLAYILNNKTISPEHYFQIQQTVSINNTGISVFEIDGEIWKLVTWNDLAHFADN